MVSPDVRLVTGDGGRTFDAVAAEAAGGGGGSGEGREVGHDGVTRLSGKRLALMPVVVEVKLPLLLRLSLTTDGLHDVAIVDVAVVDVDVFKFDLRPALTVPMLLLLLLLVTAVADAITGSGCT